MSDKTGDQREACYYKVDFQPASRHFATSFLT